MAFGLYNDALTSVKEALSRRGDALVSVHQVKSSKKYRVEVVADQNGSRRRWYLGSNAYPKGNKNRRDLQEEARLAGVWRPPQDSTIVPRLSDTRKEVEAWAEALPVREKRPRDCQKKTAPEDARPEKSGGACEGAGRPTGSYGRRRPREILAEYEAAAKAGQSTCAHVAAEKLPEPMLEAARAVQDHEHVASCVPQTPSKQRRASETGS